MKKLVLSIIATLIFLVSNAQYTYTPPWHKFTTPNGYIDIGSAYPNWAHIYTDRPNFILNKGLYIMPGILSSYSSADLIFQTHGTTRMTLLNANGNIGIGTTTPAQKLHVNGNIRFDSRTAYFGAYQNLYGDNSYALYYKSNHSTVTKMIFRDKENKIYGAVHGGGDGAYFGLLDADGHWSYLAAKDSYTEFRINNSVKMKILGSGNVGIDITNPLAKLHVNGNIKTNRQGVCGTYNNTQVQGIWSIDRTWAVNTTSNDFGTQYGIVYAHTNAGTSGDKKPISGWGHQILFTGNGNRFASISISNGNAYFSGNIGIGTTTPDNKLDVKGVIRAEEVKVETGWADFVFDKNYPLPTLEEIENHIQTEGHLPDIPTAKEVAENGIALGEMNAKLLQKIEELTLYVIEQNKRIEILEKEQKKNNE